MNTIAGMNNITGMNNINTNTNRNTNTNNNTDKLIKIYFLLFQITTVYGDK